MLQEYFSNVNMTILLLKLMLHQRKYLLEGIMDNLLITDALLTQIIYS